jgi:biopolymer transport protein ExbD
MAEMNLASDSKRARKGNTHSTKVDLTAMVDLGFLLITFFMLASTMNKPHTMELNKMTDVGTPPHFPESKTMTLMLSKEKVYCYTATSDANQVLVDSVSYSANGLRKAIYQRQNEVAQKHGSSDELFVLIKPLSTSIFQNTIDVLDEMKITGVKRYSVLDANDDVDILVAKKVGQKL